MPTCCVVLPLVPLEVGDAIDRGDWPPHITVVGDLRLPTGATDTAAAVLRRFASEAEPVEAVVGPEARFGDGTVVVDLVDSPAARSMHGALLSALEQEVDGLEVVTPAYARGGYRPHRTAVSGPRPDRGDLLRMTDAALVELDPPGLPGIGVVLARWPIGAASATSMDAADVGRVLAALDEASVGAWVIGGWGVDALVGAATREHHDLDLLVDAEDTERALDALARTGFAVGSVWSENRWTGRPPRFTPSAFVAVDRVGREVDVHTVDVDGDVVRPLSVSDAVLPPRPLAATGRIGGRPVPCATADAQLAMHSGYVLPPRQERDVAVLRRLTAS